MWQLTVHRWVGDREEAIRTSLDDHLAWMRQQQLAGRVLIAGPSADQELGIIVFGHLSKAEVEEVCRQEPFIVRGYRECEVITWDVHHLLGIGGFDKKTIAAMTQASHG